MPSDIKIQKSRMREALKKKLELLSPRARQIKNRKILLRVLKHPAYRRCRTLLTYVSFGTEVQTSGLILKALEDGKQVYAPLVLSGKKIRIYRVANFRKDLRKGAYGILEPKPSRSRLGKPASIELAFVPGLGFDRKGRRLGRGAGYFDRFLARLSGAEKIGLAFRCQMVKRVPVAKHDLPVDQVITE